jgi:hypothetical protein
MTRLYHVDIARHAAAADHKWVDNLLSHYEIPGVDGGRQGSPRRLSHEGIQHIALVRLLTQELEIPVRSAVRIAKRLMVADSAPLAFGSGLELRLDLESFRLNVQALIADGVECVVPARRGRPRKTQSAGLIGIGSRGESSPTSLPHHRTCGSASGGSVS